MNIFEKIYKLLIVKIFLIIALIIFLSFLNLFIIIKDKDTINYLIEEIILISKDLL